MTNLMPDERRVVRMPPRHSMSEIVLSQERFRKLYGHLNKLAVCIRLALLDRERERG